VVRALDVIASDGLVWAVLTGLLAVSTYPSGKGLSPRRAGLGLGALALIELVITAQRGLVCSPLPRPVDDPRFSELVRDMRAKKSGPMRVAGCRHVFEDLESARRGVEKTNVNDSFQIQHAADLYEKLYPLLDDTAVVHAERPMDRAVARFRG